MNPAKAIREIEWLQSEVPGMARFDTELSAKVMDEIGARPAGVFSRVRQALGFSSSAAPADAAAQSAHDHVEAELARLREEVRSGNYVDPVEARLQQMKVELGLAPAPAPAPIRVTEIKPIRVNAEVVGSNPAPYYPAPASQLALPAPARRLALPPGK